MVRIGDKEGIKRGHNLGTKLTFTSEPPTLTPMSFGQDVVNEGDMVKVKVIAVDDRGKVKLSLKDAVAEE